ncbi:nucleoside deaminase [Rhodococcus hoagii]|nr:nucleoside deaminase [Prescottella equi]
MIARDGDIVARGQNRVLLTATSRPRRDRGHPQGRPGTQRGGAEHLARARRRVHPEAGAAAGGLAGSGTRTGTDVGMEIYTCGAPCPMCMSAIYWSRLDAVYFASDLAATSHIGFDDAFQYGDSPVRSRSGPSSRATARRHWAPLRTRRGPRSPKHPY